LRSISGVLNGTTNVILDQLANGFDFPQAVLAAQQHGYAEHDPQLDLDGTDAAQKLILLARAAFAVDLPLTSIPKQGIQNLKPEQLKHARNNGRITRLVAECRREPHGFLTTVSPIELPFDHPLAQVNGVENRLIIQSESGRTWNVAGRGAGRWPTTEAVMADLFDLRRALAGNSIEEEQERVA
jgi:homoserine dehydrogenase